MRVILKQDVETVGRKGEIKDVADGYARNFLFPRKMAVAATKGNISNLEHFRASAEKKHAVERDEATKLAKQIEDLELKIEARAGEKNKLFGSVTPHQIADLIKDLASIEIDKKKIDLAQDIKVLGRHKVRIHVYPEVFVDTEVEVVRKKDGKETKDVAAEPLPAGRQVQVGEVKEKKTKKKAKTEDEATVEAEEAETEEVKEVEGLEEEEPDESGG